MTSTTSSQTRVSVRLIALATVVLTLFALREARPVMLPLVTGLVIAMLAWPVQARLQRAGAPRWLALLATVLVVILVLVALIAAVGWSVASVAEEMVRRQARLAMFEQQANAIASRFGVELPRSDDGRSSELVKRIGGALYAGAGYLALAVGFAALALAELRATRLKVRQRFSDPRAERLLGISAEVAGDVRRYFAVKSLTSGIAGASTGLLAFAVGLDFAPIWALLAFLFEYVPTIGSMIAVIPPSLYAVLQFEGVAKPVAVLAAFTVMQTVLGNYVDPRIEGKLLSLSPLVVLLSIVFWAWLWGAPGSLLGVPLTVAAVAITRHFDGTRWIWSLLTEPSDDEREGDKVRSR
jgi:AI-2 transport protein TqsA